MRFKYLTATMLRNVAFRLMEDENTTGFMCIDLRLELRSLGFVPGSQEYNGANTEFKKVLQEMRVSTDGSLDHPERTYRDGINGEWKEEARIMFLLMLADAIAYKPNGGKKAVMKSKRNDEWFPTSVNPPRPGVYERDFGRKTYPHKEAEYNYWDGTQWWYGCQSVQGTIEMQKENRLGVRRLESDWRFIQDPVDIATEEKWYNERN